MCSQKRLNADILIISHFANGNKIIFLFSAVWAFNNSIISSVKGIILIPACVSAVGAGYNQRTEGKSKLFISVALKSIPRLKAIFDTHYPKQPKKFNDLFQVSKELLIDEIIALYARETANEGEINALDVLNPIWQIVVSARAFVANYESITIGGER